MTADLHVSRKNKFLTPPPARNRKLRFRCKYAHPAFPPSLAVLRDVRTDVWHWSSSTWLLLLCIFRLKFIVFTTTFYLSLLQQNIFFQLFRSYKVTSSSLLSFVFDNVQSSRSSAGRPPRFHPGTGDGSPCLTDCSQSGNFYTGSWDARVRSWNNSRHIDVSDKGELSGVSVSQTAEIHRKSEATTQPPHPTGVAISDLQMIWSWI